MIDIREELSKNFIDFAAEANGQRAFPDADRKSTRLNSSHRL